MMPVIPRLVPSLCSTILALFLACLPISRLSFTALFLSESTGDSGGRVDHAGLRRLRRGPGQVSRPRWFVSCILLQSCNPIPFLLFSSPLSMSLHPPYLWYGLIPRHLSVQCAHPSRQRSGITSACAISERKSSPRYFSPILSRVFDHITSYIDPVVVPYFLPS